MTSSTPCSACSWTTERQKGCRYESHVKLFNGCSDRGVWSLGSQLILNERGANSHRGYEAPNIPICAREDNNPRSGGCRSWEEDGHAFTLSRRIPGETLHQAWPRLADHEKEGIAKETADYLLQLRDLQSDKIQALGGQPFYCNFLIISEDRRPSGHDSFSSDAELWAAMETSLKDIPQAARAGLRKRMPPAKPYTFAHSDLTDVNIMVQNGHLTGILDWELAGVCPVWWEYVGTSIGDSEKDRDWKVLLRKYMPDYSEAREFWRDYYHLSRYPEGERARTFLEETERELSC